MRGSYQMSKFQSFSRVCTARTKAIRARSSAYWEAEATWLSFTRRHCPIATGRNVGSPSNKGDAERQFMMKKTTVRILRDAIYQAPGTITQ